MKVAFFTNDSSMFGANRSLLNMLSVLSQSCIEFLVITPYFGPLNGELKKRNIRCCVVRYNTDCAEISVSLLGKLLFFMKRLKRDYINSQARNKLRHILEDEKVDLIHSNSSVLSIGFEMSQMLRLKHIWHLREFINLDHNQMPFSGWYEHVRKIRKSSHVICISHSIANHFGLSENFNVIYNAVMPTSSVLAGEKSKENYLLVCASLTPNKGVDDAIRAFAHVARKFPTLRLKIAGSETSEPGYFNFLNGMASELDIVEKVDFLGYVSETRSLMHNALALLMCSKNEAMGRVTAEAMLSNCLVLGYDNAGTSELISHGITGYLFSNLDDLVQLIEQLCDNKLSSSLVRKEALAFATNLFTEEAVRSKLVSVFHKLLSHER